MSNARKIADLVKGTEVKVGNIDSDISNTLNVLKARLDSDDGRLQSLSSNINSKIAIIKSRLDSDDAKLQALDTAISATFKNFADSDVIISQIQAKVNSIIANLDSDTIVLQNINTKIGIVKTRLDSDTSKLSSIDQNIGEFQSRLDSDSNAIQAAASLAASAASSAGMSDSDLKVVADLRNIIDSEILYVRSLNLSYTNYTYIATADQTTFTGSDANSLTLAYTAGSIQVFLNGIRMEADDFTATDGTSVVLVEGAKVSAQLTIIVPKLESNYVFSPDLFNWTAATQQALLSASPSGSSGAGFGDKTDLSGDGNYAVVGARTQSGGGAVYVFKRTGSTWAQQQKLAVGSAFGFGARINETGDAIVIGSTNVDNKGAAYVYTRSGSTWSLQQKIQPAGMDDGDNFGNSVDISNDGNIIVVGHQYDDVGGTQAGSAYIFTRSGSTWTQQIKLAASNAAAGNQFGHSVAISGDGGTVIIGAHAKTTNTGSAYIFTGSGSSWTQQAEIAASDAATNSSFAYSVAIDKDGNTAACGSMDDADYTNAGAVYVFTTTNGTSWSQQTKISSPNATAADWFGSGLAGAVDISDSGYDIIVGAYDDTGNGAAYIFQRSGSTWTQKKRLVASDAASNDRFGWNVAISSDGSTGIVGATNNTVTNAGDGTAYIFTT